jgi:hypothetical protein
MHLAFNSIALYQIGPQVEEVFGSAKFIFIYLATGIFAGIASMVINPSFTAGASGAIFGLIGLMAVYGYRLGGTYGRALMRSMLIWAAFGFVIGLSPGINNIAHGGGFVAGGALGFLISPESPRSHTAARIWNIVMIICVLAVAGSLAMAGSNFSTEEALAADARNVVDLSQRMRYADRLFVDAEQASANKDLQQAADALRSAARDITSIPHIDDRSDAIKQQYADQLTKRADVLAAAAKNKAVPPAVPPADVNATEDALNAYLEWEESVLKKYHLERRRQ